MNGILESIEKVNIKIIKEVQSGYLGELENGLVGLLHKKTINASDIIQEGDSMSVYITNIKHDSVRKLIFFDSRDNDNTDKKKLLINELVKLNKTYTSYINNMDDVSDDIDSVFELLLKLTLSAENIFNEYIEINGYTIANKRLYTIMVNKKKRLDRELKKIISIREKLPKKATVDTIVNDTKVKNVSIFNKVYNFFKNI